MWPDCDKHSSIVHSLYATRDDAAAAEFVVTLVDLADVPLADLAVEKAVLHQQEIARSDAQLVDVLCIVLEMRSYIEMIASARVNHAVL